MAKVDGTQMALAVMAHAQEHYTSGWDVVVECYDTKDLEDLITSLGATTVEEAIRLVGYELAIYVDRRQDVLAEVF